MARNADESGAPEQSAAHVMAGDSSPVSAAPTAKSPSAPSAPSSTSSAAGAASQPTVAASSSSNSTSSSGSVGADVETIERQQSLLREITTTALITLILFLGLHYSAQAVPLDGPSMQPGLHTDERVLVNSLAYTFHGPQRGDVVVFHPPTAVNERYIKRVIGTPGDTIVLTPNQVTVNGVTLDEPYITPPPPGETENPEPQTITLGPDQYFVMGDNRTNSQDSRFFGPITTQALIGKAEFVVWPLSSIHQIDTYSEVFSQIPAPAASGLRPLSAHR